MRAPRRIALLVCICTYAAIVLTWLAGCGWFGGVRDDEIGPEIEPEEKPLIDVRLSGRAEVMRIRDRSALPPGPGAEGRPGDFLLRNAFVRFVVGGTRHVHTSPQYAGCLIDAALYDGEDRLRLFSPRIGAPLSGRRDAGIVVCDDVRALGGPSSTSRVAVGVSGHLANEPGLRVRTTYSLAAAAPELTITTEIGNRTDKTIAGLALTDLVCQGRTERFAPGKGLGLEPVGMSGATEWLALFGGGTVLGIYSATGLHMQSRHTPGWSRLLYAESGIAPGKKCTYRRVVSVATGTPARVMEGLLVRDLGPKGRVVMRLTGSEAKSVIVGAYVTLIAPDGSPVVMDLSDAGGEASFRVREGQYLIRCRSPGRAPLDIPGAAKRNATQTLETAMSPRAMLRLRVSEAMPDGARPTSARVTIHSAARTTLQPPERRTLSGAGAGRTVLVPDSGEVLIPLPPGRAGCPGDYRLVVSKGPLYELAQVSISTRAGETTDTGITLHRSVDPGRWVAVDAEQRCDTAPDSALLPEERALLNRTEGLAAGVAITEWPAQQSAGLTPGLRLNTPAIGELIVLPLPIGMGQVLPLPPPRERGSSADEVFHLLRIHFPVALLCLSDPVGKDLSPVSEHHGAVMLLTGADTLGARRRLRRWYEMLNDGRRLVALGGSGSGSVSNLAALSARTWLLRSPTGEADQTAPLARELRALLHSPAAFVSNGPFLDVTAGGRPIGSVVPAADGKVDLNVRVHAPTWMDVARVRVVHQGRQIQEWRIGKRNGTMVIEKILSIPVERDGWVVVQAEGDKGMAPAYCDRNGLGAVPFAVTNPFWLDADGNGLIELRR